MQGFFSDFDNDQILRNDEKWYDLTREEQMVKNMQKVKRLYEMNKQKYFHNVGNMYFYPTHLFQGLVRVKYNPLASLGTPHIDVLHHRGQPG